MMLCMPEVSPRVVFSVVETNLSNIQRPVLLITDGHKSHLALDAIDTCRDKNIVLFCYLLIQFMLFSC